MKPRILQLMLSFVVAVGLIAVLAQLTAEPKDPCAAAQSDLSAAVLAEEGGDQSALTNRAILMRGKCKSDQQQKTP